MKPETWVQVYHYANFEPGPDGEPRREFQRTEWDMPLVYFVPTRHTRNGNVWQEWRKVKP